MVIVGSIIAGVVVLAVLAAVLFAVPGLPGHATPRSGQTTGQPRAALPIPPAAKPVAPADSRSVLIPTLPGPPHPFNGAVAPASLSGARQGILPAQTRNFALGNGMIDGWFNGSDGVPAVSLIAIRMPTESAAANLEKVYLGGQVGLLPDNALSYQGVQAMSTGSGTFRTAYVTHQWTVILEVTGPADQQQASMNVFQSELREQLAQSPPTVRS
jgi:hypothetical protein